MFKDLFKFFRRNASGGSVEDEEEFDNKTPKFKKLIKLIIIVTIVIVVLFTVFSAYAYFSIDCEKVTQDFLDKRSEYTSLIIEKGNNRQYAMSLAYTNEIINIYENQIIFLNENEQCASNENWYTSSEEIYKSLIEWKAIQLQLTINLNK